MNLASVNGLLFFGIFAFYFLREVSTEGWRTFFDYLFKMCIGAWAVVFVFFAMEGANILTFKY